MAASDLPPADRLREALDRDPSARASIEKLTPLLRDALRALTCEAERSGLVEGTPQHADLHRKPDQVRSLRQRGLRAEPVDLCVSAARPLDPLVFVARYLLRHRDDAAAAAAAAVESAE